MIPLSANHAAHKDHATALITPQLQRIAQDFGLTVHIASEIEFYLHGSSAANVDPLYFYAEVKKRAEEQGITIASIEEERGFEQHEAALAVCDDAVKTANDTVALKQIITELATGFDMKADFRAKPQADQPGSGLHIHVHLADRKGKNTFFKNDDEISDTLKFSIGGLLSWLPDSLAVFAPQANSYSRFSGGGNAPATISWGANNRTVAVRLPDSDHDNKHIEHRVAGSDADPASVIAVILAAIHYGLTQKCDPGQQIYGDAALDQYDLPKLASTLEDALVAFHASPLIADYFSSNAKLRN